jgi:hypothetical protein
MKIEQMRFQKIYEKKGLACVHLEPWESLVKYWFEHATKERSSQLINARGALVKVSKYGLGEKFGLK